MPITMDSIKDHLRMMLLAPGESCEEVEEIDELPELPDYLKCSTEWVRVPTPCEKDGNENDES